MGVISLLGVILLVLLVLVCGKSGLTIFFGLLLNFVLLFITVTLFGLGAPPVLTTILASAVILAVVVFFSAASNRVTRIAYVVSLGVMLILAGLAWLIQFFGNIQGFGNEVGEDIGGFSLLIGVSFGQIVVSILMLSALGAVAEASIAVTSGLFEVADQVPDITPAQLFKDGQEIGGKIIGTALNTLFFGFFGSYLALFIWFVQLKYAPGLLFNDKLFVSEAASVLLSTVGVVATVPLSTWVVSVTLQHEAVQAARKEDH
ncbi:YibE/F family protein [Schleiferilactobacillus harbinensis]|jgi:uncharacterized membrane protein|uniref:YibE/F family protein n=1 Tax=Schleiferilactobacillus harbinensis TaxID=304207 RepID=UPI001AAFF0D7|nr:YibE/F family protein [Schleiferilactobacillus harbinensis]MBO3092838.1 YibE/F family protein [Schleiferilactobacillus harbinensis]